GQGAGPDGAGAVADPGRHGRRGHGRPAGPPPGAGGVRAGRGAAGAGGNAARGGGAGRGGRSGGAGSGTGRGVRGTGPPGLTGGGSRAGRLVRTASALAAELPEREEPRPGKADPAGEALATEPEARRIGRSEERRVGKEG